MTAKRRSKRLHCRYRFTMEGQVKNFFSLKVSKNFFSLRIRRGFKWLGILLISFFSFVGGMIYNTQVDKELSPTLELTKTHSNPWGGIQLWEAVNKRRQELGVEPLEVRDELCTIAAIRLAEQLDLGRLDRHEGFGTLVERRPDLQWIFDKYNKIMEFLASGGESAEATVAMWEDALGHRKLLTDGNYKWGCIYSENNFAVAEAAY